MGGSKEFSVSVSRREVVAAALPLQEHWLPLSNLDLLLPSLDVGVFFCYRKSTAAKLIRGHAAAANSQQLIMGVLKKSLAQVLVTYYPFAGEVVPNLAGEPELLCNNRGVDFVEAHADVELADLPLHNPDESVDKKLVPVKKNGVLCVQATALKCGGLVVACSFDHRVADAHSANMFFVSWAEATQYSSKPISFVPSFRRSLLSPRRPGFYDAAIDDLYVPLSSLPPPDPCSNKNATGAAATCDHPTNHVNRIYCIVADDIARIQAVAAGGARAGACKRTALEAFTAYLWWILGGSLDAGATCSMGVVVDGRPRLLQSSCSSMDTYFGNVLSIPYATLAAEELRGMDLNEVADAVHACVARASSREHFLGLIDWVEAHRPEPAVARIYALGGGKIHNTAVVVSSGRRFPVEKVDFGWGKPAFGSYHFPWGGGAGYVMPMPSARGDGNWVVYAHLPGKLVEVLEAVAGDVFRPLTADYLGFDNLSTIEMT